MNALVAAPIHTENVVQSTELSLDLVGKQVKCNRQSDQNRMATASPLPGERVSLFTHSWQN